ncbi:MAG: acyltransferase [Proteobacteria bacterium]|nr:acyltransferase [Pseudomonadota bacterium]
MACSAGGYIGVDVFFVISGFLITTIIVREIAAQNFSIASFYERRVRRILPAIMAVVIFCLVVGSLLLETGDFENLARSSIANNLFPSNIYFYFQTGYFDAPAELKPLLHTWSLSVEEQYYLIFPLLLLLIARYCSRKYLHFLLPLLLLWFAACVHGMSQDPSAVFYFLPTRGWELLIGSVLAIAAIPPLLNTIGRNALALLGLALIVYSVAAFNDDTLVSGIDCRDTHDRVGTGDLRRRIRRNSGQSSVVDQANGLYRIDLVLAVPLALAAHCICQILQGRRLESPGGIAAAARHFHGSSAFVAIY